MNGNKVICLDNYRTRRQFADHLVKMVKSANHEFEMRNVLWALQDLGDRITQTDRETVLEAMKARRWQIYLAKHGPGGGHAA